MKDSPLIPLQLGHHNTPPMICIPGAGASVTSFMELAEHLDDGRPIFGLQPRGMDDLFLPHTTVVSAAEYYLRAINDLHPGIPVHLLGHSFGGWVAFEMALQSLNGRQPVLSIAITDSDSPADDELVGRQYDDVDVLVEWVDALHLLSKKVVGIKREDFSSRNESDRRIFIHRIMVDSGLMPKHSRPDSLRGPLRTFAASLRTHYTPSGIYTEPASLILADDPRRDHSSNESRREQVVNRWRNWIPNLVYSQATGNHLTMLKSPHANSLSKMVRDRW
jgi:thioesterase domain-containing protein